MSTLCKLKNLQATDLKYQITADGSNRATFVESVLSDTADFKRRTEFFGTVDMFTVELVTIALTGSIARSVQHWIINSFTIAKGFAFEITFLIIARLEVFTVETVVVRRDRKWLKFKAIKVIYARSTHLFTQHSPSFLSGSQPSSS